MVVAEMHGSVSCSCSSLDLCLQGGLSHGTEHRDLSLDRERKVRMILLKADILLINRVPMSDCRFVKLHV